MIMRNIISLLPTYYSLYKDVKRQKSYIKKVIDPFIDNVRDGNDGTLDEEDFHKIRHYYGMGVPAIVGEGFCTLRGKAMSDKERIACTYQGALTGLYDDFFDKANMEQDDIRKMMDTPDPARAGSSLEELFVRSLVNVHKNISNKDKFAVAFDRVFVAQVESRKQLNPDISWDEIRDISFLKGGVSLLFYRSIFENEPAGGEEEALYEAGALMQLGNDIFDVYKDKAQDIHTLPTVCKKIDDVRKIFEAQLARTITMIEQTAVDNEYRKRYIRKLLLGISRCYVCLDHLERLENKTGGVFKPGEYSRKEMICDMERPVNILRSIRYYLSYKF